MLKVPPEAHVVDDVIAALAVYWQIVTPVVVGPAFTDIALLFEPVVAGLLAITRIIYPVPVAVPKGIVAEIVPEFALLVKVPIVVGDENEPVELDNCAV